MQQSSATIEEQRKTALTDLASLGRVSHRLAMVDTSEKFQAVLDKLLPRLLQRIGDNHQQQLQTKDAELQDTLSKIHLKLVEMLSHVMKRVRDDQACQLNANGILSLLVEARSREDTMTLDDNPDSTDKADTPVSAVLTARECDSFSLNLSLAFLALAVPRSTSAQLETVLPGLLVLLAFYEGKVEQEVSGTEASTSSSTTVKQWHQISHLLLRTFEKLILDEETDMKQRKAMTNTRNNNANKRIKTQQEQDKEKVSTDNESTNLGLEQARGLLIQDPAIASATYDLLLDVFLYETSVGNVPPAGLSSMGWERLKTGHSPNERDWAAEMAPPSRLASFKSRLIEWVAPHRRWGLFLGNGNDDEIAENHSDNVAFLLGKSRTLVLLVIASGDPMQSVSETAKQYLKQYFDSRRSNTDKIYGIADRVCSELLGLSVGGINAEMALGSMDQPGSVQDRLRMGFTHSNVAFRRRQISDSFYCEAIETTTKAMEDTTDTGLLDIGKLSMLSSDKMLSKLRNAMGLNSLRGRPFVLAADQLNCLVVRLEKIREQIPAKVHLQARALSLVAGVLSPIASTKVTSSSNAMSESSVAVRDSVYGVVSVLSRSSFASENFLCVMAAGNLDATSLSTDLLQILLRCVGNEVDKLKPRTMAALDALLFACRRQIQNEIGKQTIVLENSNPWVAISPPETERSTSQGFINLLATSILPLLWQSSRNTGSKQSRVAAARWASDLLINLDLVRATQLLCFLSGDADVTAASIAREGLGLGKEKEVEIAAFEDLSKSLFSQMDQPSRPGFWEFSAKGKATAVKCLLRSFLDDFHGDQADLSLMIEALAKCLLEVSTDMDLIDGCAEALSICLGISSTARSLVASSCFGLGPEELRVLVLSSGSAKARRCLAEAFGHLMMDVSNFDTSRWTAIVSTSISNASDVLNQEPLRSSAEVHGTALLGGLCTHLLHKELTFDWDVTLIKAAGIMESLGSGLISPDDTVGNFCSDGISFLTWFGDARRLRESLVQGMTVLLSRLEQSLLRFGNGDRTNAPRILRVLEPAGPAMSLAYSRATLGITNSLSDCVFAAVKLLGSDSYRKDEDISLSVGEVLAEYACAFDSTVDLSVDFRSNWPNDMNETFARSLIPPAQVLYCLVRVAKTTNNNHQRRACAAAMLALVAKGANSHASTPLRTYLQCMLEEIQDCFLFLLVDGKSSQLSRESCCLGLIALNKLVKNSDEEKTIQGRLLQGFGQTTNYGGSAMQETAAQAEERRRNEGNSTQVVEQTGYFVEAEVGGVAGMSEASLGAYVEMASAAVACGRPHLVYSMLMLSVSHPVWNMKKRRDLYGPAALHGGDFKKDEVKMALRPYLARLLPRVLRACHDPNKQTREQMETLWIGLTGGGEEGRLAISRYLRPTIDALVEETSSKLWRTRVGACGALAQVIVGRSWIDLGGGEAVLDENYDLVISKTASEGTVAGVRLLRLWRCCLRALDDVRVTVRESGEALGRSVRSLTIRLCNPKQELDEDCELDATDLDKAATAAAATALRFLLKSGLKQQCPEAAGICISTLIGIIDIGAKPAIFEALLADVIYALLVALSNLEPAALSYLSVRQEAGSAEFEDLAKLRLTAAQNSPLAMAVRKCIDMVPLLTTSRYQDAVVGSIESAIRKSTGIATRSACADCIITLCHTMPDMFRLNASANSLLRCFFEGIFKERGGKAAQNKMNAAFGPLASLCSSAEVRRISLACVERYTLSHGNSDDPDSRHAAALALRSIAVKAPGQLSQQSELWVKRILPVSFLGMKEPNNPDSSLWKEVWEDGGAAIDFALGHTDENTMEEKLLPYLVKESVDALRDVSWSRRTTGAFALADLAEKGVLTPPPRRLDGQYLPEIQRRAARRAEASLLAISCLVQLVARSRVWTGKAEVVKAISKIVITWVQFADPGESKKLFGDRASPPIVNGGCSTSLDLFRGDQWFVKFENGREDAADAMSDEDENDIIQSDDAQSQSFEANPVCITGLCRLLLLQSFPSAAALRSVTTDEVLPFRSQVLQSLEEVLRSLPNFTLDSDKVRSMAATLCAPTLYEAFGDLSTKEQPLIIARTIGCFAATLRSNMSFSGSESDSHLDAAKLCSLFLHHVDYTKQSAWTVREAAAKCTAKMVQCADVETLRRGQFVLDIVKISAVASKDRKFWKVRYSSLLILQAVVARGGGDKGGATTKEKELILEAVLPYKENIQDLGRKSLNDTEAQVTALATKILGLLTTWP